MPSNSPATRILVKIDQYLAANRQAVVEDMQAILRFETVSGGKTDAEQASWRAGIREGFDWLEQRAEAHGLAHRNLEDTVCVIEKPGSDGTLGVLLHLDVVPPGEGWSHPPFGGEIADGIIFGRGCQDDKGPVIQMLHGLLAVQSLGLPFRRTVRLIVGSEEETGVWADVKRYLELERAPDFSIVPDGTFPIVNGEKGMVDVRVWTPLAGGESGAMQLISATAGVRSNVVPPLAQVIVQCDAEGEALLRAKLGDYLRRHAEAKAEPSAEPSQLRITFHGKNAHGSQPWEGRNAARDALRFLAELPLEGPKANFARLMAAMAADDEGKAMDIANRHEFIQQTTQSLGVLRIEGAQCEAVLNIRHTPPQTCALIAERVQLAARNFIDGDLVPQVEIQGRSYDPLYVDPQRYPEYFQALETAYRTVTGREAKHVHTGGTTFAKAFPNAMCFGPTDAAEEKELAHQADERIAIDHLIRNVRIYALAMGLLALDFSDWM